MAYAIQPDYLKQNSVLSKDNAPMAIIDIFLDDITNVSIIFPNKARNDKRFYAIDFKNEELKELLVFERIKELLHYGFYILNLDDVFTDFPDKTVEFIANYK